MKYLILDLETSSLAKDCDIIVLITKKANEPTRLVYRKSGIDKQTDLKIPEDTDFIVGHNLKFDLYRLWENKGLQDYIARGGRVWCTQYAEYLISGQTDIMNSLKNTCVKYFGGSLKVDEVSTMFKAGYGAHQVPKDLLLKYSNYDGIETEKLFLAQYTKVVEQGLLDLVLTYQEYLLALTEEEYNGLYWDKEESSKDQKKYEELKNEVLDEVKLMVKTKYDYPEFNLSSPSQLSALCFGGPLSYSKNMTQTNEDGSPLLIKSGLKQGQPKLRKRIFTVNFPGLFSSRGRVGTSKEGVYKTDFKVLSSLKDKDPLIPKIIKYKKATKLITSYYKKQDEFCDKNSIIHQAYQNVLTVTGRLSCTSPNMQNQPAQTKFCIKSRFGNEGILVEADFSQLEVVIAGALSNDTLLLSEVISNVDMHQRMAAFLTNKSEDEVLPEERRLAKFLTFGILYGKHFKSMAESHELPVDVCEAFINKFYSDYFGIKEWHDSLENEVRKNSYPTEELLQIRDPLLKKFITVPGMTAHKSIYTSLSGKRYVHTERGFLCRDGSVFKHWHLPDIKNYPVQGTAADIQACTQAYLFRKLLSYRNQVLMINEVHDSKIFDCKISFLPKLREILKEMIDNFENIFYTYFKVRIMAPLRIDIKVGKSWGEME